MTLAHYRIIRAAIDVIRRVEGQPDMSKSRALELICADYLAGVPQWAFQKLRKEAPPLAPIEDLGVIARREKINSPGFAKALRQIVERRKSDAGAVPAPRPGEVTGK